MAFSSFLDHIFHGKNFFFSVLGFGRLEMLRFMGGTSKSKVKQAIGWRSSVGFVQLKRLKLCVSYVLVRI